MPNTSHMKRNLDLIKREAAEQKAAAAAADKAAESEARKTAELARNLANQEEEKRRKKSLASNREGKHIKPSTLGKPALGVCTTANAETPEQRRARIEDRKAAATAKAAGAINGKILPVHTQVDGKLLQAVLVKPPRQRNADFYDKSAVSEHAALDTSTLFNPANPFNAPTKVAVPNPVLNVHRWLANN